ncbi:hypothetical protein JNUCC23_09470 [Peribacillus sp. JNUCC 23]
MRKFQLVEDLVFNKKYKEINGYVDLNNSTYFLDNQHRNLYDAEEVVEVPEEHSGIIENVVKGYEDLFLKRRIAPTEAQLDFARTTAKILLGELHDENTIPVIPAPCGFGKSTITYVFLKELCKAIKGGLFTKGLIIVTDKLAELKKIHNDLIAEIGYYKIEVVNKREFKTPYTYVLEGWTDRSYDEGICLNKKVNYYKPGMCSQMSCPFFNECKMSKQRNAQAFSPILLMTNARLETFGENINQYGTYIDENGKAHKRTMIINDEKPKMMDDVKVSIPLLNTIENDIHNLHIRSDSERKDQAKLREKWTRIRTMLNDKINIYAEKYDRFLVSNINNEPILLNDQDFVELWDNLMGNKYKNEIKHIHTVFTRGGLFCNTKKGIFISTISMKDLVNKNYKSVIFDATSLVDPDYSSSTGGVYHDVIRFIDIENVRAFENVTFHFYQAHKINKTELNSKRYIINAGVKFLESLPKNILTYAVTYKEVAVKMLRELKNKGNIVIKNGDEIWGQTNKIELVTYDDESLFYFGNTKGSNKAKDCIQMVQFGWNTLPDYEYAIRHLCTDFNKERLDIIFQKCGDMKVAESFSKLLQQGKDYKFANPHLYLYQNYSMVTDFIQEVFRTKLRNYNFTGKVDVHCFKSDSVLIGMVEQLFPGCKTNIVYEKLSCFQEEKIANRKNGDKASILLEFVEDWEVGKQFKTKEICDATGLTTKDIDNLKSKNTYFKDLFNKYKVKRGVFIKVS